MSRPYYDQPLQPPAEQRDGPTVQRNDVNDMVTGPPGDDPTVPGTQPRGAPYLDTPEGKEAKAMWSKEARAQQATSGKSRADSGTP
jgi:hypothetical protein